jgi:DegV family protein with EDD domain
MRIGVVVDASCDLPRSYLESHGIHVLPNVLSFGKKRFEDARDPEATMNLFRRLIADKSVEVTSQACGVDQIRDLFLEEVVADYDRVLVVSACARRSEVFKNATEASYAILQSYRELRNEAGQSGSFALRVLDSATLCAGHALVACRAVTEASTGAVPFEKLRTSLKYEAGRVRTLLVPNDLFYVRHRGLGGPGDMLGGSDYALGRMARLRPVIEVSGGESRVAGRGRGFESAASVALDQAREAVRRGLGAPVVTLSFGGDPRLVRDLHAYQDLEAQAASQRVELHLAVMSATMGVRLGPGALSVAWMEQEG